jgi:S1-C subfamily serine protease
MNSVKTWRRAALAAYVLAGAGLASGGYALASVQANVNAIAAAQKRLDDDEWSKHQAHAKTDSGRSAAGEGVELDAPPYPAAVDWSAVAGQVMPSVVMVAVIERAKGDGSRNRAWLVPGVQTNLATELLTRYRAWQHEWAKADQEREWVTRGAGFLVGDGRTALTAAHVLAGRDGVRVKLASGEWRSARGARIDQVRDVAALMIDGEPGQPVRVAPALPRQGQAIAAIGSPNGLDFSMSAGIAGRHGQVGGLMGEAPMLQIAAPIIGGNSSGGPVFNGRGEAVGLVSNGTGPFNQAVPIGRALAVAGL